MRGPKLLLALGLSVTALGAVTASVVANNNAAINKFYSSHAEKLPVISEGGATPGNAFYVMDFTYDDSWDNQWYVGNGRNVWAHFFQDGVDGKSVDVNLGNEITFGHDFGGHARRIVEGRVPAYIDGITAWDRVILVRVDASYDHIAWPSTDSEHASNQTSTITLTNSTSINAIRVNSDSNVGYDQYVSAALRIEKWALAEGEWNSATNGICVADGSTDAGVLKDSWDATALTYAAIKGDDVKSFFSNETAVKYGSRCQDLAKRYDEILAKHPTFDNFAHR